MNTQKPRLVILRDDSKYKECNFCHSSNDDIFVLKTNKNLSIAVSICKSCMTKISDYMYNE